MFTFGQSKWKTTEQTVHKTFFKNIHLKRNSVQNPATSSCGGSLLQPKEKSLHTHHPTPIQTRRILYSGHQVS